MGEFDFIKEMDMTKYKKKTDVVTKDPITTKEPTGNSSIPNFVPESNRPLKLIMLNALGTTEEEAIEKAVKEGGYYYGLRNRDGKSYYDIYVSKYSKLVNRT